jgi:hypothetical protein
MDELTKITDKIVEIIGAAEGDTMPGVRLGAALKKYFPSFAPAVYQCRNLRLFIKTHVPKVIEKTYTGVDVIYTLAEAAPSEHDTNQSSPAALPSDPPTFVSLPADPVTWKAYSNPAYHFMVIANRETGELKAVGEHETPREPWMPIPKLSPAAHHQIATEFVSSLSDGGPKTALMNMLAEPQWYVDFFATTRRLALDQQWGRFKREQLIRNFTTALTERGVPTVARHDLPPSRVQSTVKRSADIKRSSDDAQLRELVSRLAFTLPIDELRSIRMPIGLVLDAVRQ